MNDRITKTENSLKEKAQGNDDKMEDCDPVTESGSEYNNQLFMKLSREMNIGDDTHIQTEIKSSIEELIAKPNESKTPLEKQMDELFLEYLPKEFIEFNDEVTNK